MNKILIKIVIRAILYICLLTAMVFILADRFSYWQGWVLIGFNVITMTTFVILFSDNTDLIKERMKPGPGVKWWDKLFLGLFLPLSTSVIAVGCLDAGKYQWSESMPVFLYPLAYILYLFSIAIGWYSMKTNKFFSSMVRIQKDRNHSVIDSGPYKYVRHPGYTGAILGFISTPVILGSYWAFIPAVITIIAMLIRTYLEDNTLKNELSGYLEYSQKTRFRIIPGLW